MHPIFFVPATAGLVHFEGICNETYARACFLHGRHSAGKTYLSRARQCYSVWGAERKVQVRAWHAIGLLLYDHEGVVYHHRVLYVMIIRVLYAIIIYVYYMIVTLPMKAMNEEFASYMNPTGKIVRNKLSPNLSPNLNDVVLPTGGCVPQHAFIHEFSDTYII